MKRLSVIAMLLCCAVFAFCACGSNEETADTSSDGSALTVTVYADVQLDGEMTRDFGTIEVSSDAAENAGLADSVDSASAVSALDVLAALHTEMYPDFNADTAGDYVVVDGGWMNKAFEYETANWSVILNAEAPHGDAESSYGGFEPLTVDQTEVNDGDVVEFVTYCDTENYSDEEIWFYSDGNRGNTFAFNPGEEFSLNLKSYCFSFYGNYGEEAISEGYLAASDNIKLSVYDAQGNEVDCGEAVTDAEGNVSLTIEEPGSYNVIASPAEGNTFFYFNTPLMIDIME